MSDHSQLPHQRRPGGDSGTAIFNADRSSHSDSHIAQQNFLDGFHPFQFRHWEPRGKLFHTPPMSSTLKGLIT